MRKEIVMGTVLLLPLLAAAADFTPLGLKPGLWESTVNMKTSGSPMANIPPEQRSQMEAAMANMPPMPPSPAGCHGSSATAETEPTRAAAAKDRTHMCDFMAAPA